MSSITDQFHSWIKENQFLRISIVRPKDGRQIILGRILNFDEERGSLLIYHSDERKTYLIMLNELEDIQPAGLKCAEESFKKEENIIKKSEIKKTDEHKKSKNGKILSEKSDIKVYPSVYDEIQDIICNLSSRELHALLPVLQLIKKIKFENSDEI